jgi:cytidylate kinase
MDHGEMKAAAQGFSSSTAPRQVATLIQGAVPREIVSIANAFIRLQEERHRADYDLGSRFDRATAEGSVVLASRLFQDWTIVRGTDEAKVFLAALTFHKRWNR